MTTPSDPAGELAAAVERAALRIAPYLRETPLLRSRDLSERTGAEVFLKLENLQRTGSFKARGALNRMLCLSPEERSRGVVAASTGNHGAAVAYGSRSLGVPAMVFVPEAAQPGKLAAIESYGIDIRRVEGDPVRAEQAARRYAGERGMTYLSPYNDWQVVAGQGTVGPELEPIVEGLDELYVAVGGGGLISGVAAWLRARRPGVRVIGCSPAASPVMFDSVRAGEVLEVASRPTLSDGTAGGVEPGAITLELCSALVDDWVTVEEEEIRDALVSFLAPHRMLIEGAAAVAVAALLRRGGRAGRRIGVVICGGNLDLTTLRTLLA